MAAPADLAMLEESSSRIGSTLSRVEGDVVRLKAFLYNNPLRDSADGHKAIAALRTRIDRFRAANKELKERVCTVRLQNVETRKSIERTEGRIAELTAKAQEQKKLAAASNARAEALRGSADKVARQIHRLRQEESRRARSKRVRGHVGAAAAPSRPRRSSSPAFVTQMLGALAQRSAAPARPAAAPAKAVLLSGRYLRGLKAQERLRRVEDELRGIGEAVQETEPRALERAVEETMGALKSARAREALAQQEVEELEERRQATQLQLNSARMRALDRQHRRQEEEEERSQARQREEERAAKLREQVEAQDAAISACKRRLTKLEHVFQAGSLNGRVDAEAIPHTQIPALLGTLELRVRALARMRQRAEEEVRRQRIRQERQQQQAQEQLFADHLSEASSVR